ncbi:hypothetical protein IQ279_14730, partial [Streptomyces verrucosisporus]|uniref:WXG100 family type VII secretion target n=1 Tax=Streptomyces verrucosisporus TaxID=1695161 RepID=UPI003556EF3D|nr:hypothetical protein [Streptomyces verrucosisporus]
MSFDEEWARLVAKATREQAARTRPNTLDGGEGGGGADKTLHVTPGELIKRAGKTDTIRGNFAKADNAVIEKTEEVPGGLKGFKSAAAFTTFQERREEQMKYLQGLLDNGVAKWKNLPGKFTTIATSFKTEVSGALLASDWAGEAAKAAFKKFDQVQKQMGNAAEEAGDVHRLLDSALESFRSAQKRLRNIADEVSEDRNLKLSSAGLVYLDPDDKKKPERLAVLKQAYEDVIRGYNDRVKSALEDATEADTALHWALSQDPNGRSPGFHPDMFRGIREAQQGQGRARKDADTLVELTSLGPGITDEQLEQFNRLARKHEGDPYFAERFAVRTGPEGTLRFWQGIADQRHHSDKDALKTLAGIQKSLSHTLATASHSQSEAMQEWKKKMIGLGEERIYFIHSGETAMLPSQGSYGFSIMSSIMRHGEYETEFLKDYGKELYSFEMKHEGNLKELWYVDDRKARLSFGSDSGNDPMAGYMEALGHNPEASKEMFLREGEKKGDPEEEVKERLR